MRTHRPIGSVHLHYRFISIIGSLECHVLMTPHSWADGTSFGGPPIPGSAPEEATWAHALTHRREAFHIVESTATAGKIRPSGSSTAYADERGARSADAIIGARRGERRWCARSLGECQPSSTWAPKAINGLLNEALADADARDAGDSRPGGHGAAMPPSLREYGCSLESSR